MAVSFGIVGVAVLFWLFIEIIKNAWKNRETPLGYFLLSTSLVIFISGVFNFPDPGYRDPVHFCAVSRIPARISFVPRANNHSPEANCFNLQAKP